MMVEWQSEDAEGALWAATIADGQQGWFEIQIEHTHDRWEWVINHDCRFAGPKNTLDRAKIAVAAQLEQTGRHFPRCKIRPFSENEDGGYLISFPDFPGVVASGALPEEAIWRARDAIVAASCAARLGRAAGAALGAVTEPGVTES